MIQVIIQNWMVDVDHEPKLKCWYTEHFFEDQDALDHYLYVAPTKGKDGREYTLHVIEQYQLFYPRLKKVK